MTVTQNPPARSSRRGEFWRRTWAMLVKEFIQLKRDRVSFAMIIMIPLMQLMLFGYAINTKPRHLPTAVLLQESSDVGRSILRALENTHYFKITHLVRDEAEFDRLLASGTVLFAIEIPANFERDVRRGDRPAILVAATRPTRWRPARRSPRSTASCRRRCARPRRARGRARRRSKSAPTPATIRPPRPRSTSCRAWSAPSSP